MLDLRQTHLRQLMERTLVEALGVGYSAQMRSTPLFPCSFLPGSERRQQPPASAVPVAGERLFTFAGSHDLALEALWLQARRTHAQERFTARYIGSIDGLLQLLHGEAALAGAHMLDEESGEYNLPILRRLFVGQRLSVITLAEREQGLIVAAGNPKAH